MKSHIAQTGVMAGKRVRCTAVNHCTLSPDGDHIDFHDRQAMNAYNEINSDFPDLIDSGGAVLDGLTVDTANCGALRQVAMAMNRIEWEKKALESGGPIDDELHDKTMGAGVKAENALLSNRNSLNKNMKRNRVFQIEDSDVILGSDWSNVGSYTTGEYGERQVFTNGSTIATISPETDETPYTTILMTSKDTPGSIMSTAVETGEPIDLDDHEKIMKKFKNTVSALQDATMYGPTAKITVFPESMSVSYDDNAGHHVSNDSPVSIAEKLHNLGMEDSARDLENVIDYAEGHRDDLSTWW